METRGRDKVAVSELARSRDGHSGELHLRFLIEPCDTAGVLDSCGVELVELRMARAAKKPGVWLPTEGEDVWVLAKVTRTAPDDEGLLDQITVPNGL